MHNPGKRFFYVLTAWEEREASAGRPAVWRFSLEDTRARRRLGFRDLDDLTAFLHTRVDETDETKGAEDEQT